MKLNIITCTTGTLRYAWETYVLLNNLRERQMSGNTHVLVWVPFNQLKFPIPELWTKLEKDFPETTIEYFEDYENFQQLCERFDYNPLFRPHILAKHYRSHPELSEEAIFYIDSDILITKDVDFEPYLQDDNTCFLSDTNSYINATYFDSKKEFLPDMSPRFVAPEKMKEFLKRDILGECASFAGITREICMKNDNVSGGAQYLMKKLTAEFWEDVLDTTINVKMHLAAVNQEFMQDQTHIDPMMNKENVGYQSWCADMWGVLWNLWKNRYETKTPKQFNFTWATDEIIDDKGSKLERNFLFHNAGITGDSVIRTSKKDENGRSYFIDAPAFFKGGFVDKTPFEFPNDLNTIVTNETSSTFGTAYYAAQLLLTKEKYNL